MRKRGELIFIQSNDRCIQVSGWDTENGASVGMTSCSKSNTPTSQQWQLKGKQIVSLEDHKCLEVQNADDDNGTIVQMWNCNPNSNQQVQV